MYSPASRKRDPRRNRNLGDIVIVVVAVIVVVGTKSVWTSRALSPLYMCTTTPSSSSKDFHPSGWCCHLFHVAERPPRRSDPSVSLPTRGYHRMDHVSHRSSLLLHPETSHPSKWTRFFNNSRWDRSIRNVYWITGNNWEKFCAPNRDSCPTFFDVLGFLVTISWTLLA